MLTANRVFNCKNCRTSAFKRNKHFCSIDCETDYRNKHKDFNPMFGKKHSELSKEKISKHASKRIGELNPNWKGNNISKKGGSIRARRMYKLKPCEICNSKKSERHHIDGNTINNNITNIKFLCRKHHMETDGRLKRLHNMK